MLIYDCTVLHFCKCIKQSRFRTDRERDPSWIFLFNKAKRFVKLAQTDSLPAAIHLSAILTPKLLIPLNLSPSVTILDLLLLFGCSNSPFSSLWHIFIDSLTHGACWQTDLYMRDMRYPVNEYGWSRPSVHLPLGLTDTAHWQQSARGWNESENGVDVNEAIMFSQGKSNAWRDSFSLIYTPCKAESGGVTCEILQTVWKCQH